MQWLANYLLEPLVALLAEGVDRNNVDVTYYINRSESPSSQRAWIEISN